MTCDQRAVFLDGEARPVGDFDAGAEAFGYGHCGIGRAGVEDHDLGRQARNTFQTPGQTRFFIARDDCHRQRQRTFSRDSHACCLRAQLRRYLNSNPGWSAACGESRIAA